MSRPGYIKLLENGELAIRVKEAKELLKECCLCPRMCGVDRTAGKTGVCRSDERIMLSSYNLHFGEEPPVSGKRGSGTIFFSNCTMKCIYCQNYPISQLGVGRIISSFELGNIMLKLQKRGAHNINIVTGTHFIPQIIEALYIASNKGLNIPVVYNTSGYERVEILRYLEGIVDVYLPDIRYSSNQFAGIYSATPDYVDYNRPAIKEMLRQTGELEVDSEGVAVKGLIIRHLILPENIAETEKAFQFIKTLEEQEGKKIYVSIMTQYFPAWKAVKDKVLHRKISKKEVEYVLELLDNYKIYHGWIQDDESPEYCNKICI